MDDASDIPGLSRLHHIQGILCGIPAVDDDWKLNLPSQIHLCLKPFFLYIVGRFLPVVIQADFAHGLYLPAATLFLNPL